MSDDPTLAAIEQRAQAATEGPWTRSGTSVSRQYDTGVLGIASCYPLGKKADAEFIAHARTDVPYLLDRLRTVTAERDEAQEAALQAEKDAEGL